MLSVSNAPATPAVAVSTPLTAAPPGGSSDTAAMSTTNVLVDPNGTPATNAIFPGVTSPTAGLCVVTSPTPRRLSSLTSAAATSAFSSMTGAWWRSRCGWFVSSFVRSFVLSFVERHGLFAWLLDDDKSASLSSYVHVWSLLGFAGVCSQGRASAVRGDVVADANPQVHGQVQARGVGL